jgi:NAD(P)H dehydrogenase (quinone)
MANAVAAVEIEHVPELVSDEIAKASYYKLEQPAPVAKIEDLANCDAIVVGTGTRFGRNTVDAHTQWYPTHIT